VPRKTFVASEILTAADVNTNLMDQAVMTFADAAARGSAIPSPSEGMTTYLEDSNILSIYDGSDWKNSLGVTGGILQVVSVVKTDSFASSSIASGAVSGEISGYTATITPRSTSSKILVVAQVSSGHGTTDRSSAPVLYRDGSIVAGAIGGTAGSRSLATSGGGQASNSTQITTPIIYLDSPGSTSALVYGVRLLNGSDASGVVTLNRSGSDADSSRQVRAISTIILMEVAG
jgi:hypothetical protein